jgi:hypothetical protein
MTCLIGATLAIVDGLRLFLAFSKEIVYVVYNDFCVVCSVLGRVLSSGDVLGGLVLLAAAALGSTAKIMMREVLK